MEKINSESSFDPAAFAQKKAAEMQEAIELSRAPQDEEPQEEVVEELPEEETQDVTQEETVEEPQEEAVKEEMTDRERALLKELARVKADRREEKQKIELAQIQSTVDDEDVSKSEALIYSAWRTEALEEFVEAHPEYTKNPRLKELFEEEYADRLPELVYAKRHNIPVTKKFFKDRLYRVHQAVRDIGSIAKEEGKKELLKTQSAATIMAAGSGKSDQTPAVQPKKTILKKGNSLSDWMSKKT